MRKHIRAIIILGLLSNVARAHDDGWATGAGVFGLAATPIATSLGVAAVATNGEDVAPIALGASCYSLVATTVPIVSGGGSSARHGKANGVPALRIVSWITYGISMANGAAMLAIGIADGYVPSGLIIAEIGTGLVSMVTMSADALASGAGARAAAPTPETRRVALGVTPLHNGVAARLRIGL